MTFNLQKMDIEDQTPNRLAPSPNAMDRSCALVDDEIALVAAFVEGKVVIKVSDVESYGLERRLIGDSMDEDSNNDNKGVTQGVERPSAPERHAIEMDAPSTTLTKAGSVSIPATNEFYNEAGRAPHPDAIIPKPESNWWTAHEERKQRKAQERELAAFQLCEVQQQAAQLAEQNAALERELWDARQSLSGVDPTTAPSTSAASVEDPVVVLLPTPMGHAVRPLSLHSAVSAISLRASGSDIGEHQVYPRVKDMLTPSRSHFQSLNNSLRFEVEEDLKFGDPSQGVQGLSLHDGGSGSLMGVLEGEDYEGEVGEGKHYKRKGYFN